MSVGQTIRTSNVTINQGILKGKYHCTINLLFDWFVLVCFANKTKLFSKHTADSKPVKQEVNGTVILPPLAFAASTVDTGAKLGKGM
jgi:hypothetical protein